MRTHRESLKGFGSVPATFMIVGEFPCKQDISNKKAFSGDDGDELKKILDSSGINRNECFFTDVIKVRPCGNIREEFFLDKSCTKPNVVLESYLRQLAAEVAEVNPAVIIAIGKLALLALTGKDDLRKWRGTLLQTLPEYGIRKCISTYHPAAAIHNWEWQPFVLQDFRRSAFEARLPDGEVTQRKFL